MSMDEELFDLKLVQLVEQNRHLYHRGTKDFKNKVRRYKSWEAIGNTLGETGEFCERRWNVLRTRFAKEKRMEQEKLTIGGETNYSSQWPLYHPMMFLSRHVKSRSSYKSLTISSSSPFNLLDPKASSAPSDESLYDNSNAELNNFGSSEVPLKLKSEHVEIQYDGQETNGINNFHHDENSNDSEESVCADDTLNHKRRKLTDQNIARDLVSNVKLISDYFRKKSTEKQNDSDYAFAKTIYMQLREIDDIDRKNLIKGKIMQCFSNCSSD